MTRTRNDLLNRFIIKQKINIYSNEMKIGFLTQILALFCRVFKYGHLIMLTKTIISKRDIMPFFTPDIDSIDIAVNGNLQAVMTEAMVAAMVEAMVKSTV